VTCGVNDPQVGVLITGVSSEDLSQFGISKEESIGSRSVRIEVDDIRCFQRACEENVDDVATGSEKCVFDLVLPPRSKDPRDLPLGIWGG